MKKFVSLLLVVMVLGAAFACTAWAEEFEGEGEYAQPAYAVTREEVIKAGGKITTEPKCEEVGEGIYNGTPVEIEALGHAWEKTDLTAPECEKAGSQDYKCSRCGATKTEEVPAMHHDYTKVVDVPGHEATCTKDGLTMVVCSLCGEEKPDQKYQVKAALGHEYGEPDENGKYKDGEFAWVKDFTVENPEGEDMKPTCTKEGRFYLVCKRCNAPSEIMTVPALGHAAKEEWTAFEESERVTAADVKKDKTKTENYKAATCVEDGFETYRCPVCAGEEPNGTEKRTLEKLGHDYGEAVVTKVRSCTEEGEKTYTCQREGCTDKTEGHVKTEVVPMAEHQWEKVEKKSKAATCVEAGSDFYTCSVCKAEKTEVVKALGHDHEYADNYFNHYIEDFANGIKTEDTYEIWSAKVTKAASCQAEGVLTVTCTRCEGALEGGQYTITLPKADHVWNEWQMVVNPADNNGVGRWTRTCSTKGCTEYEVFDGPVAPDAGKDYRFPAVSITKTGSAAYKYNGFSGTEFEYYVDIIGSDITDTNVTVTLDGKPYMDGGMMYGNGAWIFAPDGTYGTFVLTVKVTDKYGYTAEASITEVVAAPAVKNGLVAEDGTIRAYKDGKIDTSVNGLVEFNGGSFVMKKGELDKSAEGLTKVGEDWYYCSYGQVHTDISQLVPYNGGWFFVSNGKLDRTKEGLVEYDGGKFIVSAGQVHYEYTGLWQDPATGTWAYYDHGQFWPSFSGEVEYDGVTFQVKDGLLAA